MNWIQIAMRAIDRFGDVVGERGCSTTVFIRDNAITEAVSMFRLQHPTAVRITVDLAL